jgi:bacillithiol biosynthesis cysteine-adding enzyme BshC
MMRLHPTPIPAPMARPVVRPGRALTDLISAIVPAPGVEGLLPALDAPDLLVVTTGQQAGLFTGPLYSVYKALSAAALARHLAALWGRPVIPIFWVAGDDHDFVEAAAASWVDENGTIGRVTLPARPGNAPMLPMYRELLGPGIEDLLGTFLAHLPAGAHKGWAADWLGRHYRAGQTVAGAYGRAMAELLAPHGILCLDSTHPTLKRQAAPHLLGALDAAAELDAALVEEGARYTRAGELPPVLVGDGATLVFLEDRLGRDRLMPEGRAFATRRGGDRFTRADLGEIAAKSPERLSASVLLRPVLESAVLPTVAYVAGPGELRYLAMTGPVYQHLETWRQAPVPRWSGVVVEPFADRILAKFGLDIEELAVAGSGPERRILKEHLPPVVRQGLEALQLRPGELLDALTPEALAIDPTLVGPLGAARRQVDWAVRDLERKLLGRLRAREGVELDQIARLRAALRPGGKPQERILTVAPFLARHGPGFLHTVFEAASRHHAAALDGAPPLP